MCAFNLTPRSAIFVVLSHSAQSFFPGIDGVYGAPSPLVNAAGEQVGTSERGCGQDAALLYCVAIQQALVDIQTRLNNHYEDSIANQQHPEEVIGTQRCVVLGYLDNCTIGVARSPGSRDRLV